MYYVHTYVRLNASLALVVCWTSKLFYNQL
jgi:hypothetical protein